MGVASTSPVIKIRGEFERIKFHAPRQESKGHGQGYRLVPKRLAGDFLDLFAVPLAIHVRWIRKEKTRTITGELRMMNSQSECVLRMRVRLSQRNAGAVFVKFYGTEMERSSFAEPFNN